MRDVSQFLRIARISGAHGLTGRLKIHIISDIIERFASGNTLFLKIDDEFKPFLCLEFIEQQRKDSLLKLENIEDIDRARSLKGVEIYINKSEAEKTREFLGKDNFYYYDLIGCKAFWKNVYFAEVTDIFEAGENSVLVLRDEKGSEYMIPFIESMVDTTGISQGRVDIHPVDGLFDENIQKR